MAGKEGFEPPLPDSESGVLPLDDFLIKAGKEGLEPPLSDSKSGVLPLDDFPIEYGDPRLGREDSNLHCLIQSQASCH